MAPAPVWRGIAVPAFTVTALVSLGALAPATEPAAHAAVVRAAATSRVPADPGVDQIKKQLDALHTDAEKLTEQYNKTRVRLDQARKAQQAATAKAAQLERQAAPAREELSRLAAAQYMAGGPDMAFGSGNTAGLSSSAYLAQSRAALVKRYQAQIDRALAAERAAKARTAQVQQAIARTQAARDAAKAKVGEVQKRLDKLTTTKVDDGNTGLSAKVKGTGLPAEMARKAISKIGSPYVWAAAGPDSFDCSGLVVWAYKKVGKPGLPHYTGDLYQLGTKVDRGDLRSGDLVYFGGSLHHMGIYLSDGKYLHAPQTGDVVKISRMSDRSDYAGANRIT